VIAMLGGNAAWNALFFRLGALRLSSLAFVPYGMLVVALTVLMIPIYPFGGVLLSAYCGYLVYAACWSYRLWQLNDAKH
jgi:tryptophan-rich sensory protein